MQAREDVVVCLVTGNLQPIGWTKMEALGIKHLFSEPYFGGFGSDFCSGAVDESWRDRAELVRIAARRAAQHFSGACPLCPAGCAPWLPGRQAGRQPPAAWERPTPSGAIHPTSCA